MATPGVSVLAVMKGFEGEGEMVSGVAILAVALAILFAIWLVVLWGSRYFGSPEH